MSPPFLRLVETMQLAFKKSAFIINILKERQSRPVTLKRLVWGTTWNYINVFWDSLDGGGWAVACTVAGIPLQQPPLTRLASDEIKANKLNIFLCN